MRVLIACGGSGGHLLPGLAVAETLAGRRHQVKLLVSKKSVDQAASSALTGSCAGSAITVQAVGAVGYTGSRGLMRFCVRLAQAVGDCADIYKEFQPDAVLGMGGFTSAPAVMAARWRYRTATLIHESNAVPGKANHWTGKLADHIAVGLPDCAKFFGSKPVTVTGTPIRSALRQGKVPGAHARIGLDPARLTVLVMGGSQGSQAINATLAGALPWLADWKERMQFVHLSGARDEAAVRETYENNGFKATVMNFCQEMELPYSAADLVIARSGAATLTELAAFALPAILIPFPGAGDHQRQNARVFERVGAARIVEQTAADGVPTLGAEQLANEISALLDKESVRVRMAEAARSLAVNDATERNANLVEAHAN